MMKTKSLGVFSKKIGIITLNIFSLLYYIVLLRVTLSKFYHLDSEDVIVQLFGSILGLVFWGYLGIKLLQYLIRPSINFSNVREKYLNNEINTLNYKRQWQGNLKKSIAFSLLFAIPTVGISIIAMIPNYLFLSKTKI